MYVRKGGNRKRIKNNIITEIHEQPFYQVRSGADRGLLSIRNRWYPDKVKIVPTDIQLTPLTVLYWFYGDGTSTYHYQRSLQYVHLTFCTNGFSFNECEMIVDKFRSIDKHLDFFVDNSGRNQPLIRTGKMSTINTLLDYIGEPTIQSFAYKWKRPTSNGPLAPRILEIYKPGITKEELSKQLNEPITKIQHSLKHLRNIRQIPLANIQSKCPSIDLVKEDLKTLTVLEVAQKYGVPKGSIRTGLRKYGLRVKDIKK